MSNLLYTEFLAVCLQNKTNPSAWAVANGLSNGTPTYIKKGVRPKLETVKKMAEGWNDKTAKKRICIAYLKDEIERMGFRLDEIQVGEGSSPADLSTLDEDLKTVQRFMNQKPIRESMHKLALILKVAEQEEPSNLIAEAEDLALMQRARRKKKSAKTAS